MFLQKQICPRPFIRRAHTHLCRAFTFTLLLAASTAAALDFSVPYVLNGLSQSGTDALLGFGAVVGQIEVRNDDGNGIDGFDGHRHAAFAPGTAFINTGSAYTLVGYGYQDVKDFSGGNAATGDPSDSNFHGTFVAGVMANNASITVGGTTYPFSGVAPGASYYGAIFSGADTKAGFLTLKQSVDYLVNTAGARMINNSWGADATSAADLDGNDAISLLMDEYAGYQGKTGGTTGGYKDRLMVFAAGNAGSTTGLLGSPASSFNGLSVGALGAINPSATNLTDPLRAPSATIAPFSSWRPLASGRSGVDLVAPGSNLWSDLAIDVAQNFFNITSDSTVAGAADGTSFAAPHVTGEAALLYGAGTFPLTGGTTEKGAALSTDHKLIKAILINSADKIAGLDADGNAQSSWQPGLVITGSNGVPTAVAPLNYAVGAGKADANAAFQEYREAPGAFWDMQTLALTGDARDYTLGAGKFMSLADDQPFLLSLTATLVWDRHVDFSINTDAGNANLGTLDKALLSDIDLVLQEEILPGTWRDIFISAGTIGNVDHIYAPALSGTNNYRIEVRAASLADAASGGEQYAIAVSYTTIPEPSSISMLIWVGLLTVARRPPHQLPACKIQYAATSASNPT
jgi:hypothetical protein